MNINSFQIILKIKNILRAKLEDFYYEIYDKDIALQNVI